MANYVATIMTPTSASSKPVPLFHPVRDYYAVIYQATANLTLQTVMVNVFICPETGNTQEYLHLIKIPDKLKWSKFIPNDIGRLFQVLGKIQVTNTCFFTHRYQIPQGSKVTCSHILCDIFPQKKETRIVKLTVGVYKLTFDVLFSTPC